MYIIKHIPEDFQVEEIPLEVGKSGHYTYFILKKKNKTTQEAINQLAKKWKIPAKNIGYAGLKDKHAITTQICSVRGKVTEFPIIGKSNEPISFGMLKGNKFKITVRNIKTRPKPITFIPNYFDSQRFGEHNIQIGKSLVKKDFKTAAKLANLDTTEPIKSLRSISLRILKLYVHAYQSWLWNKSLTELLTKKEKMGEVKTDFNTLIFPTEFLHQEIPMPGFAQNSPVLKTEGITTRDFIIRQIPELSMEGTMRLAMVHVNNCEVSELSTDKFSELQKCTVNFSLPKGSYATIAIRQMWISE